MSVAILTIVAAAALAFANGSNDVSKGIATLAGCRRASYSRAIAWGTLWTAAGAAASLVISVGLVKTFTSALVSADVLGLPAFPLAVAAAAAAWVLLASATGIPVSTTHAITGAVVGVALMAGGPASVRWGLLFVGIAAPLALSPLVSGALAYGVYAVTARVSSACVCVEEDATAVAVDHSGAVTAMSVPQVVVAADGCEATAGRWRLMPVDVAHWGAAAALSFARGVNDNPKVAALAVLGLAGVGASLELAFVLTAAAMTVGGYWAGLRVSRTLGDRVVHMDRDAGLSGALVSAALVLAASFYTLPVSTTHVSTGAIVGAGLGRRSGAVEWDTVRVLVSAWIITLPAAAALGGLALWALATTAQAEGL